VPLDERVEIAAPHEHTLANSAAWKIATTSGVQVSALAERGADLIDPIGGADVTFEHRCRFLAGNAPRLDFKSGSCYG